VAGDLNGDGKPEMVALDASGESVIIYMNGGNADEPKFNGEAFGSKNKYIKKLAGADPTQDWSAEAGAEITIGDLNGDGKNDILIAGRWGFEYFENIKNVPKDDEDYPAAGEPQFAKKDISSALKFNFNFCQAKVEPHADCLINGDASTAKQLNCPFPSCNHAAGMVYPRPWCFQAVLPTEH
jgi:hypothetical protein